MPFFETSFDTETREMLARVMDEVCDELQGKAGEPDTAARTMVAMAFGGRR